MSAPDPATDPSRHGGLPRWLKAALLVVLIAVAVVVLFTWVFPWVEERTQVPTMGATDATAVVVHPTATGPR